MKTRRRFIDVKLGSDDDSDTDVDKVKEESKDHAVTEILSVHIKRKKLRRKMRAAPEVNWFNLGCWLKHPFSFKDV